MRRVFSPSKGNISLIMSRLMWSIYLLHTKYNWHHVIHIILQLYMIVDLGPKLKSMSVRSWRWTLLHLGNMLIGSISSITQIMCYKETSLRNAWMKPNGAGGCFIEFYKETKKGIHRNVVIKKTIRSYLGISLWCAITRIWCILCMWCTNHM